MRFLSPGNGNTVVFDRYFEYIESIRDRLSVAAYQFASNYEHYDMQSNKSLHDAWIRSINIAEWPSGARGEERELGIHVSLLGPRHDCILDLRYQRVAGYTMSVTCKNVGSTAHGDLLMHEIGVTDDGLVTHELLFESGSVLNVRSGDLRFSVTPVAAA